MEPIRLYRKRYVPDETVELKDDELLHIDKNTIVTRWHVLNPRQDIDHGISVYYLKEGFKISKIFDSENRLVYWYCDIIETCYDQESHAYTFHDLLIDIVIYPDRHVEVADLDEFADFVEQQGLPAQLLAQALRRTHHLLGYIYRGEFERLTQPIALFDNTP